MDAVADRGVIAGALQAILDLLPRRTDVEVGLPVRFGNPSMRAAADLVLTASDLADLGERLDALATDDVLWLAEPQPQGDLRRARDTVAAAVEAAQLDMPSLIRVLGPTGAHRCEKGFDALKPALRRLLAVFPILDDAAPRMEARAEPQLAGARSPVDMAYDVTLPPTLRRMILSVLRTIATTAAIARAEELGQKLEPWLALGLADAWAEAPERFAAATASIENVLAWVTRLVAEVPAAKAVERTLAQWRDEAQASGAAIYFPLDVTDREPH